MAYCHTRLQQAPHVNPDPDLSPNSLHFALQAMELQLAWAVLVSSLHEKRVLHRHNALLTMRQGSTMTCVYSQALDIAESQLASARRA